MPHTARVTQAEAQKAAQCIARENRLTARALASELGVSARTAWRALHKLGTVQCPHCLGIGRVWQEQGIPMIHKAASTRQPLPYPTREQATLKDVPAIPKAKDE